MPASGVSPPYSVPINLFRAFRIGELLGECPAQMKCACVGKFFSVDCAPLCVSSESVRFRTVLSDPEHTIRHLPVARPRVRASRLRCPLHRKRESQHRVNDCETSRCPCVGGRTRSDGRRSREVQCIPQVCCLKKSARALSTSARASAL